MAFGYEIDFLAVGSGERSGDAIAMRYGEPGAYFVHVVDGGDSAAGEQLVQHIRTHYGTNHVDAAVLTHADDDHSSGLRRVLEECTVSNLVMNRPWIHAAELVGSFRDQRWTVDGLRARLRRDFPIVAELEDLATQKETTIHDAFAGVTIANRFTILAPSRERYLQLVPQFSRTPEAATPGRDLRSVGLLRFASRVAQTAVQWIFESWHAETLAENSETSASNESSVVQFGTLGDHKALLTGDAGIQALSEAADYADVFGLPLPGLNFIQVPHHGSRHNVSPTVLDRLLGGRVAQGTTRTWAYASVAAGNTTHPRKVVTNAFLRRGAPVYVTGKMSLWYYHQMPGRATYGPITSIPFSNHVEA